MSKNNYFKYFTKPLSETKKIWCVLEKQCKFFLDGKTYAVGESRPLISGCQFLKFFFKSIHAVAVKKMLYRAKKIVQHPLGTTHTF